MNLYPAVGEVIPVAIRRWLAQRQVAIAEILESEDLSQSLANCRLEWIASAYRPVSSGHAPEA